MSIRKPSTVGTYPLGVINETAALIAVYVGSWNDNGYPEPLPFEAAHRVPSPGERSPANIKAGRDAIDAIDELHRQLDRLHEQLAAEIRADRDARGWADHDRQEHDTLDVLRGLNWTGEGLPDREAGQ